MIHDHYGDYTNIQITGGDPTLRSIPDLVEIVHEIKSYKMRCALFTNGIKASRKMLEALSVAGMDDVVFHVDMTQERKGYQSEAALNGIRLEYTNRAAGLPMRVLFNTTVFDDNVHEIPALVSFFISHADKINLTSFQMQADTGRGVLRARDGAVLTQQSMMAMIEEGAGTKLPYDMPMIGHPDCNKYTSALVAGKAVTSLYDDKKLFTTLFGSMAQSEANWSVEESVIPRAIASCFKRPILIALGIKFLTRTIWALRSGLIRGKRPHRISFFIHNFMDAKKLERGRCESCVFMVATANGPLSMCVHNAKRDQMISQAVPEKDGQRGWNPLGTNKLDASAQPFKKLKGRLRATHQTQRKKRA